PRRGRGEDAEAGLLQAVGEDRERAGRVRQIWPGNLARIPELDRDRQAHSGEAEQPAGFRRPVGIARSAGRVAEYLRRLEELRDDRRAARLKGVGEPLAIEPERDRLADEQLVHRRLRLVDR